MDKGLGKLTGRLTVVRVPHSAPMPRPAPDDTARLVLYVVWARVAGARAVAPIEAAFWAVAPDFPLPTSVVALPAIPYGPDHKLSYAALPDAQGGSCQR